jgi:DNA-binding NtrC family response regulator
MIFMTGGAFAPDIAEFMSRDTVRAIEKPFKAETLRKLIDGVLGEARNAA